jgi:hypothetical protein
MRARSLDVQRHARHRVEELAVVEHHARTAAQRDHGWRFMRYRAAAPCGRKPCRALLGIN